MSKGQMFIVAAVAILVILTLLKNNIAIVKILESKKAVEADIDNLEFENVRDEVVKVAIFSANSTVNITANTIAFLEFAKKIFAGQAESLQGIAILTAYPKVAAAADTIYNVTLYTFFDAELETLILNFTVPGNAVQQFNNIPSGSSITTNFTFNAAANANYTLWVYYKAGSTAIKNSINVPVLLGKSKFIGYYDLRLATSRKVLSDFTTEVFDLFAS
jgi:hypothetical protein